MKMNNFKLECYFEKYEFSAPYLLTQSDCEAMTVGELLDMEPGSKERFMDEWLGYSETWGNPELRKIIAGLYETLGSEDILALHGAQEGIFQYMNVMLDEGDHMIVMFPNYQSAYEVANSIPNCSYSKWNVKKKKDAPGWEVDFDELVSEIRPNTKLIAINSPNNPTGFALSNAQMDRLIDICKSHDLYLFSDEVYRGLDLDGEERYPAADKYDKAVSLGVMSKAYGLAGLRIGWLASKDHGMLEKCEKYRHYMSICNSAPSEYLTKIALRHSDELLTRSFNTIKGNLKLADEFFERNENLFENNPPMAGPIAFHKLLIDMPISKFCQLAVDKKGVLLLPGDMYDTPGNYFRMGYGRKNFPEALGKFEEFLKEEGFAS